MQLARCLVAKLDIPVISLKDIIDDTEFVSLITAIVKNNC